MPAYTTQADLEERYGTQFLVELTDRGEVATGVIDADVVTRAIAEAEALINGYLANKYALPLAEVPALIATLTRQIAIYTLHVYEPNEKIRRDYEMAIRQLQDIARGTVTLDIAGVTPEQTDGGGAQVDETVSVGLKSDMSGFI